MRIVGGVDVISKSGIDMIGLDRNVDSAGVLKFKDESLEVGYVLEIR
jgi:hypothetical protein